MSDEATPTDEQAFLERVLDAADALLDAKDKAKLLGYPVENRLSEIVQEIHKLMTTAAPDRRPLHRLVQPHMPFS